LPSIEAKRQGYPISLYLDTAENKYIEEFNVSNFIGISADGSTFVTPDSARCSISKNIFWRMVLDPTSAGLKTT
jgi:branched-subunit amino acid aminotransferase/4-amino-4-deoxychorismate lyase